MLGRHPPPVQEYFTHKHSFNFQTRWEEKNAFQVATGFRTNILFNSETFYYNCPYSAVSA